MNYSYQSGDPAVFTVDGSGRITGVKPGTATLTVTGTVGGITVAITAQVTVTEAAASSSESGSSSGGGSSSSSGSGSSTGGSSPGSSQSASGTGSLTFSGLPHTVYVGSRFTLVPSVDGRTGSDGWVWDEDYFEATFNSPATFTALKAGTTTIRFTASNGETVTATIEIVQPDTRTENPKTGGGTMILPVAAFSMMAAALALLSLGRRNK